MDPAVVIWWPRHKFLAVKKGYRLEQARQERLYAALSEDKDDDEDYDHNAESFTRPDD